MEKKDKEESEKEKSAIYMFLDTIKFVARYIYSGQGVTIDNGNIIENTSYSGRITPQSGSTGGGAAGYFYFRLNSN